MFRTKKFRHLWLLQFCLIAIVAGILYGCKSGNQTAQSPSSPVGAMPGAATKGAGVPGMKGGPGSMAVGMKGGMAPGMKGGPGSMAVGMKGGMAPGMKGGPGSMAVGMKGGMAAGMKMGAAFGMKGGMSATNFETSKPVAVTLPDDQKMGLKSVVRTPIKALNIKNWDGTVTKFLRFKAKGPMGQTLNVLLPVDYQKQELSRLGWANFFQVYAMNDAYSADQLAKGKLPDLSAATAIMADVMGTPPNAAAPAGVGAGAAGMMGGMKGAMGRPGMMGGMKGAMGGPGMMGGMKGGVGGAIPVPGMAGMKGGMAGMKGGMAGMKGGMKGGMGRPGMSGAAGKSKSSDD